MPALCPVFDIRDTERVAVFIDGSNIYTAVRSLGFDIDYSKLIAALKTRCVLIRMFYYTAIIEHDEYSPVRPLVDWLDYNGYLVVTKPAKTWVDPEGHRKVKGNMDIELACDMLTMADTYDVAILFSGDGDFCCLLDALQRRGKRVIVVSTNKTKPPMVADDLRRACDFFVELADIKPLIERDNTGRAPIRERPAMGRERAGNGNGIAHHDVTAT